MELVKTTLSELCIGKGQYGIGASAVDYSEDKYTYLRITDIKDDGTLNNDDLKSVDDPDASKYILKPNDIVFARTGASTGRNYFYDGSDGELVYAGFLIKFSIDPNKVNPRFIKYYCLSDIYKGWVIGHTNGSTRGNINAQGFGELEIYLPSREQQDKLVSILDDIEAKRKNNDQINRNLSEQLRIVFEDMFITNAEDSWPEKKVGDFLELERGLSYKGKFLAENEGTPMLNLGNILPNSVFRPEKLKYYTGEYKPRHIVRSGDIIVANTDLTQAREVLGSAIRVPDLGYDNVICSHHISIVRNCKISNNFILGLLNMPAYRTRVAGFATGTTVLALPNDTILNCEFQCTTEELLAKYDEIAEPIYAQMEEIRRENEQLSLLRDSLLPKLMSGEIDLSEVDCE